MLEENYTECLNRLLKTCPCHLVVPSEVKADLARRGFAATVHNDIRRYVRHRSAEFAVLEFEQSLAAVPRSRSVARVVTRNISRGGIAFLHADQLFPGETFTLWLPAGRMRFVTIRCRAHGDRCYEIGAEATEDKAVPLKLSQLRI